MKYLQILIEHWGLTSTGIIIIYEAIARRKATAKDWSILNLVKRIADAAIANRASNKEGGVH